MRPNARALLQAVLADRHVRPAQVVRDHTTSRSGAREDEERLGRLRESFESQFECLDSSTLDDYLVQGQDSHPVGDIFGQALPIVLKSQETSAQLFEDDKGRERFRELFPDSDGILELSSPGFSADGHQAMIEVGQQVD